MESVLPKEKAKERKNEILMTFLKMVEYARKNWVSVIIIAGDMFDTKTVSAKVRNSVMDAVKNNPGITFLYLKGNHDSENFMDTMADCPANLKFFGDEWTKYEFEDVVVAGVEINENNYDRIYDSLILDSRRFNIVVLHGQENLNNLKNNPDSISIRNLRDKNIDYLALGHVHSYKEAKLDSRGIYVYSGCLDGRGFDECGSKGFVLLEINNGDATHEFIPAASRTLYERAVDITGMQTTMQMVRKIEDNISDIDENSLVKVTLTGSVSVDSEKDIKYMEQYLNDKFYFGRIKDVTRTLINTEDYKLDPTLKGEFVRLVMASCLDEDEKEQIIVNGIRALSGEDLD
jgi:DNA repair exonuclease SbcCD nuclease subunit